MIEELRDLKPWVLVASGLVGTFGALSAVEIWRLFAESSADPSHLGLLSLTYVAAPIALAFSMIFRRSITAEVAVTQGVLAALTPLSATGFQSSVPAAVLYSFAAAGLLQINREYFQLRRAGGTGRNEPRVKMNQQLFIGVDDGGAVVPAQMEDWSISGLSLCTGRSVLLKAIPRPRRGDWLGVRFRRTEGVALRAAVAWEKDDGTFIRMGLRTDAMRPMQEIIKDSTQYRKNGIIQRMIAQGIARPRLRAFLAIACSALIVVALEASAIASSLRPW